MNIAEVMRHVKDRELFLQLHPFFCGTIFVQASHAHTPTMVVDLQWPQGVTSYHGELRWVIKDNNIVLLGGIR
jgi:hypothetical protein